MAEKELTTIALNETHVIKRLETNDEKLERFLFTLGCYPGEEITVVSIISETYVVVIKDGRYSVDKNFAKAIIVE